MIQFRKELQEKLVSLLNTWVGPGSDPSLFVKTFDERLRPVEITDMPFVVVNVRTADLNAGESEIGVDYDLYTWNVHIYYLDTNLDYKTGDDKRDVIMQKILRKLEEHRRLDNFQAVDPDGKREYVWDTKITSVLFDYTGQEEYHSFVSELYLNVDTAKG